MVIAAEHTRVLPSSPRAQKRMLRENRVRSIPMQLDQVSAVLVDTCVATAAYEWSRVATTAYDLVLYPRYMSGLLL